MYACIVYLAITHIYLLLSILSQLFNCPKTWCGDQARVYMNFWWVLSNIRRLEKANAMKMGHACYLDSRRIWILAGFQKNWNILINPQNVT